MIKIALWALLPMLLSTAAFAASDTVKLQDLLEEAEARNPAVRAARERWEAAVEIPANVGALPNPRASVDVPFSGVETRGGPVLGRASLSQEIPFPGKRGLLAQAASFEASVAEQGYRAVVLEVRARAAHAALELHHHRRMVEIFDEQIELLRHFSRVAEKKYASGRGSQIAAFRAEAELSALQNRRTKAHFQVRAETLRLNALLGRPEEASSAPMALSQGSGFKVGRQELKARALAGRPELVASKAMESIGETKRRSAVKRYFPDFSVGYELTRIGSNGSGAEFDGRDAHSVRLGFSIPLWFGANRSGLEAARRGEAAAASDYEDLRRRTAAEVLALVERSQMLVEVTRRHEEIILPQFRSVLAAAQRGYEADSVSFEILLDAERDLLDQQLFHVRHHVELAKLEPLMERLIGGPL